MLQTTNQISISGFVASNPIVKTFENSAVCRFAVALSTPKKAEDGTTAYASTLLSAEIWRKNAESTTFDMLRKGENITFINAQLKVDQWLDETGSRQTRLVITGGKVIKTPTVDSDKPKKKAKTKAA